MGGNLLIVVPTLNSHHQLPELLASLKAQSWPHWQLLFIDGPSSVEHRHWLQQCCIAEARCRWLPQDPLQSGIFGAMNQGFQQAAPADWLLFWGSDDWAASSMVLGEVVEFLQQAHPVPDLLVCRGRYADPHTRLLSRSTRFASPGLQGSSGFLHALLFGSTPPHQATLFGPGARARLNRYRDSFRLAADLDYFLQLSQQPGLRVQCLDLELVHMGAAGISGQQTQRRLQEVRRAYRLAFGWLWVFPFLIRYLRRLTSLLSARF